MQNLEHKKSKIPMRYIIPAGILASFYAACLEQDQGAMRYHDEKTSTGITITVDELTPLLSIRELKYFESPGKYHCYIQKEEGEEKLRLSDYNCDGLVDAIKNNLKLEYRHRDNKAVFQKYDEQFAYLDNKYKLSKRAKHFEMVQRRLGK